MKYIKATDKNINEIYELVQATIKNIYPKYYPKEVVDFFCKHHSKENILKDINDGNVSMLLDNNTLVGTGSFVDNNITRVYVLHNFQGKGYGSYILDKIESEISKNYDKAILDSSLPASHLYEKRGYKTIKHSRHLVENGVVLVYEIMEKSLDKVTTDINYNGRIFTAKSNSENGEVDSNTIFKYYQKNNILYAEYSGGDVVKGYMIGTVSKDGALDFHYEHINEKNEVKIGKCHSTPNILDDGMIELHEEWQWLNGDKSKGTSLVVELNDN